MAQQIEIGRYLLHAELASGGMATVFLGRLRGQVGFSRTVAIKRSHPGFAKDPEFVSMFLDEARIAARIRHPNVVPVLDVEAREGELFLVMDYVHGESLARLWRLGDGAPVDPAIAGRIAADVLYGLHAAHQAKDERGQPLGVVHRDVSPQNVLVGADGIARVTDFGIAKAVNRIQTTHEGQLKGKLAYMAPEQLEEKAVDARTDVYAAAVVLWELLTGRRLHTSADVGATITRILTGKVPPPSRVVPEVPPEVDALVLRGLAKAPDDRFATAQEMAVALERTLRLALPADVADWVSARASDSLEERARLVAELETSDASHDSRESGTARAHELARAAMASAADGDVPTEPLRKSDPRASAPPLEPGSKSNVNVTRSLAPPRSGARRGVVIGVAALALIGLAIGLALRARPRPEPAAAGVVPASATASALVAPLAQPSAPVADVASPALAASAPDAATAPPRPSAKRPAVGAPAPPAAPTGKPTFGSLSRE
ncbi:MAG: serine/threonine protein kinase [Myxococcales bacterium]|nr:serine/threonine protein kinase [Myxococcales bacterium]